LRSRSQRSAAREPAPQGADRPAPARAKSQRGATSTGAAGSGRQRGPVSRAPGLDHVDRGIIEALQRNGRESFRRIAASLGVSEATVRARYARLCDQNILQVTGVTNPLGLGFEAQAMVGVRTTGPPERVADEIAQWDEADYVVVTAGRFDVLVEVVCADRHGLLDVTNRIRRLPQVVSTESFLYLELWKQLYDWGVGIDGPGNGGGR
jgi:Lrp/AsnC family transcriptional regulator for asnA, asnC and gidA